MSIVALDISTSCGVAYWPRASARPIWSTVALTGEPGEVGRPMEKLRKYLADLHQLETITHLFFEATILPGGKTTPATVFKLCATAGMAEWFGYRINAKTRSVEQQKWRKHFFGKGTGKREELKRLCVEECRRRGWHVRNDDEADALGVLDYGLACMGIEPPWRDANILGGIAARDNSPTEGRSND